MALKSRVARVRQALIDFFDRDRIETEIFVPYDRQELRGVVFGNSQVMSERFDEQGIYFTVRIDPIALSRITPQLQPAPAGLLSSNTNKEE